MSKTYEIIFTGGGSGGHVMPTVTLLNEIKDKYRIGYIGGSGIEKELIGSLGLSFHTISTGKLRRYISLENLIDVFKVIKGIFDSLFVLLRTSNKKTLVFSTGGFVTVPVVLAAWLLGRRIYIHEQTTQVGLANKIASKFASKVFVSFEDSLKYFPKEKTLVSGYPLRAELFDPSKKPIQYEGMTINESTKPLLFITGGGNGSKLVNDLIKENLEDLQKKYFIVHQVGKAFIDEYKNLKSEKYYPVAFVGSEMTDLYKWADIIISRAGAGTVCELIALNKRSIFIPLKIAQKNEQFHNAKEAESKIGSLVITEDELEKTNIDEILKEFSGGSAVTNGRPQENGKDVLLGQIKEALS
ncbi:MAG: UDP-N-acetylglucosamine--N-acetylmuramyl-(pentapeptide) pyrophosphoryl-undecaprenol N-acetylglucosamine transferase [Halobacteriovorax sp.]|nr:UDP-N-acetylglucosamine--N-acetylmuramyl-(pentapeptide) pyrophosphoryl-undecaprenol N-acetylglucosamine transferase [Halobacteriovorax sp.]|tara:strand:- start:171805 stop:172872 length:1068 start_codon:yes stop_codon:yes gene_type:complete